MLLVPSVLTIGPLCYLMGNDAEVLCYFTGYVGLHGLDFFIFSLFLFNILIIIIPKNYRSHPFGRASAVGAIK
jgi:hypothetical protein